MNYYELLGISSDATPEEIKSAYKIQMKKWHPDINKADNAASISMKINEAKEVLLDEVKRKEYDLFLKQKESNVYQKYSNVKHSTVNTGSDGVNQDSMVTKWEYLREYVNSENISLFRKSISVILVLLESLFCFIIKWFVILLSFISFSLSEVIMVLFYYIFPVVVLLLAYLIYISITKGFVDILHNHFIELRGFLVILLIYISSYFFIFIGKKLISQKVFNFLYNKLDIYLFKKAVFYKF